MLVILAGPALTISIQIARAAQTAREPVLDESSRFQILHRTVLPGEDFATALAFDPVSRHLYVGRHSRITVLDVDSGHIVGQISDTGEITALVFIPELSRGFASTSDDKLVMFDLRLLRKIATFSIPGKGPNHLTYDPSTKRVFVMNNRSQSVVAVSADHQSVLGTIPLVDDPEAAIADGRGHLYVVLADPAEIAVIDTGRLTLMQRIRLSPCNEPRGIVMDTHARRLFVGCSNGFLAIADPDRAQLIARLSIEPNSVEVSFDTRSQLVFAANPAGMVSIVSQRFPDRYRLLSSLKTGQPIAGMALDPLHRHLLVAVAGKSRAALEPRTAKSPPNLILTIGKVDPQPTP